jgi:hypothetical protein
VHDPLGDVAFHLLEYGAEQLLLADEVVIQRAPGHPGLTHDVLPGRAGETPRCEQRPTRIEQGPAGRRRALGLPPAAAGPSP